MKKKIFAIVAAALVAVMCFGVTAFATSNGVINKSNGPTYEVNPDRGDWTETQYINNGNGTATVVYTNTFRIDNVVSAISAARKQADAEIDTLTAYAEKRGWSWDNIENTKVADSATATTAQTALRFYYEYKTSDGKTRTRSFNFVQYVWTKNDGTLQSDYYQAKGGNIDYNTVYKLDDVKRALENYKK